MFAKIEANFWHYINKSQVKRLLIVENSLSEESGKALEEIMLCTTSIFIVLGKNLDAIEMINRSKSFCKEFRLKKVQNMLKLIEAALRSSIGFRFKKRADSIKKPISAHRRRRAV